MNKKKTFRVVTCAPLPADFPLPVQWEDAAESSGRIGAIHGVTPELELQLMTACRRLMVGGATLGLCDTQVQVQAVFFDMDSTVIAEESIVELARAAGKEREVMEITERAMAGGLDFSASLVERVAMLQGLPQSVITAVAKRLTLNNGIVDFAKLAAQINVPLFLISGGFNPLAKVVSQSLGFADFRANELEVNQQILTGKVVGAIIDAAAKQSYLTSTCARLGISPLAAAAVGDGANDLPMLQAAGLAVGYKPKTLLIPHLHGTVWHGDHRFLAPLLFGRQLLPRVSPSPLT